MRLFFLWKHRITSTNDWNVEADDAEEGASKLRGKSATAGGAGGGVSVTVRGDEEGQGAIQLYCTTGKNTSRAFYIHVGFWAKGHAASCCHAACWHLPFQIAALVPWYVNVCVCDRQR